MNYISLKYVVTYLNCPSEEYIFENKALVIEKIQEKYALNDFFIQESFRFQLHELIQFIQNLNDKKIIVFDQWVHESESIAKLLIEKKLTKNKFGTKLLDHFLFFEFKRFISPFILPLLLQKMEENFNKNKDICASFLIVLDDNTQLILEDKIIQKVNESWGNMILFFTKNENIENFNSEIKQFYSDALIEIINAFSKKNYAFKIQFIENVKEILNHTNASAPLALFLIHKLKKLELNNEHMEFIQKMFDEIRSGRLKFLKSQNNSNKNIKFFKIASIFLGFSFILFFLFYSLFYDYNEEFDNDSSSFKHFTKEERKQLDSLIHQMEKKPEIDEEKVSQNQNYLHLNPVELLIQKRLTLKNQLAESYTKDCLKAYELESEGKINSCYSYKSNQIKNINIQPFLNLNKNRGEKSIYIKNQSDYQVQILVFKNDKMEFVYSSFISENSELKFKMSKNQMIVFIPGKQLGKANNLSSMGISENYKNHFCKLDDNFVSNLLNPYLMNTSYLDNEVKILLNQNDQDEFYIIDIHQALLMR